MKTVTRLFAVTQNGISFPLDEPRAYVKGAIAHYKVMQGYGMLSSVFQSADIKECKTFIRENRG